ncbi:MAG: transglycosylase SLT domain-containing protein [Paracoccaceae bacterium]
MTPIENDKWFACAAIRINWKWWFAFGLLICLPLLMATPGKADGAADLCEAAAYEAAHLTGVPFEVLKAITLAETGRRSADGQTRSWPWAVNQGGAGQWFETPEEALSYVAEVLDSGLRNVDLGCFQLNHRWHAEGFASLEDMIDPSKNALYAANFLSGLYDQHGDWSKAAGAYHSNTPEYAERYRERFDALYADLAGQDLPPQEEFAALAPRRNLFPLLRGGGATGNGGSLVPLFSGAQPLIGGNP